MILRAEKIIEKLFLLSALFSAFITFSIFLFLFYLGLPLIKGGHFLALLTEPWAPHLNQFGIVAMIAGTLVISLLSMFVAFPVSLGCSILIHVERRLLFSRFLAKTVALMTGIPTVIYGFVGIFLLVPLVREIFDSGSGLCVITAVFMVSLLVAPTMILFFCDSFARVPRSYGNAVLAIGGSDIQKFIYVTLPSAWSGVLVGFTLALGRALGDTLIALMIAGNAVQVPGSLFDPARTLTSHIALIFAADYESMEFKAIFACGMFLYLFSTILVLLVRYITGHRSSMCR